MLLSRQLPSFRTGVRCAACKLRHERQVRAVSCCAQHAQDTSAETHYDVRDKVVLITGGARGIGYETAKALGVMGATVYITDINRESILQAITRIANEVQDSVDVRPAPPADLGSQSQVAAFAAEFQSLLGEEGGALDVLVNNAGANFLGVKPWHTEQGVAGLPQVNIVGPMHLTMRLLPPLLKSPAPRLVNVASIMHRHAAIPVPDEFLRDWWVGGSYRNCKLVLVALSALLHRELQDVGLVSSCADPGLVYSGLWSTSKTFGQPPGSWVMQLLCAPPSDAATTVIHCASSPHIQPGGYYARGMFASDPVVGAFSEPLSGLLSCLDWPLRRVSGGRLCSDILQVPPSPDAADLVSARALWGAIADLSGMPRGFKHLKPHEQQEAPPVQLPPGFEDAKYH